MEILPVGSLSDFDKDLYGSNLYNLSVLKRANFSVAEGIIILPPEIILQIALKHLKDNKKEVFEASLVLIKSELSKIPVPDDLAEKIKGKSHYFLNGFVYEKKEDLWKKLLEFWLDEIRQKIWNDGLGKGIASNLSAQTVFFIKDKFEVAQCWYDPLREDVIISSETKLSPPLMNKIDKLVISANKKLFIPQVFTLLILSDDVKIISLKPFTESLPMTQKEEIVLPEARQKKIIKSAVKLFLNLSSGFAIDPAIDGLLIEGEHSRDFDELVFKLTESVLAYPNNPVLYKLADVDEGELKASMRLLHRKDMLKSSAEAYLFVRNKKNMLNLQVIIPKVRSLNEFLEMKRELSSRGISRKGSMRLGLEMGIPENIINIEGYLESGLDDILLDLDYLQKNLSGNHNNQPDLIKEHIQTLIKFIIPFFAVCHKAKIPVITKGSVQNHPDLLDFLVEKGVYGVVANTLADTSSLPEHLHWVEARIFKKHFC